MNSPTLSKPMKLEEGGISVNYLDFWATVGDDNSKSLQKIIPDRDQIGTRFSKIRTKKG